jgi:hypothetical protein
MNSLAPTKAAVASLLMLLLIAGVSPAQRKAKTQTGAPRADDETIVAQVTAKMSEDRSLAGMEIKVAAKSGVVTLTGTVSSLARKRLAARAAMSVKGVKRVVNKLEVVAVILQDYECCCNGECYISSRPCPLCPGPISACVQDYKQAIVAAHGDREAQAKAREAFYDCIHKQYP